MMFKLCLIATAAALAVTAQAGKPSSSTTAAPAAKTTARPDFSLNLTFVLSGINLPTKDKNSKADGFVKVFKLDATKPEKEAETLLGTTDTIKDNENPQWLNVFWIQWKRGTNQKIKFDVIDHNSLGRNDDIGTAVLDLDQYVEKNRDVTLPISGGGMLRVKETQPTAFKVYCRMIPNKDPLNGKSDPYVEVYWRQGKDSKEDPLIGTTAVIDNQENPDFPETFYFDNYQKGTDQYLFFKVYDKDNVSSDFIGELLVEADPYVAKRATKITKLTKSDNKATLAITPV